MPKAARGGLFAVFAATGFSALTLQVVWQRVISLHAGVDLLASTTVITAFLAGLGLGNLLGGAAADRWGGRRSLRAFAAANLLIGIFAWASLWLLYDLYRSIAARVDSPIEMFAFHFLLLLVPTTLMGASLPLLSKGAVAAASDIAPVVGGLYAINTLGAAAGAIVAGWWLLGTFGFVTTVRIAGTLNLLAALAVWGIAGRRRDEASTTHGPIGAPRGPRLDPRLRPWLALYALTGAVAVGLEVLYFRIVDAILRNNSYTFATVLAIYLLLFAGGTSAAARFLSRRRVGRPEIWFLSLQFLVGATSLAGIWALLHPPAIGGFAAFVERYYTTVGFMEGRYAFSSLADVARFAYAHLLAPLLVMGSPVFLMGASFPFIQAHVARDLDSLGRSTGALLCSNLIGNVTGGAITGFLLIDRLGTPGTLLLFACLLAIPGLFAAWRAPTAFARRTGAAAVVAVVGLGALAHPSNERFWAFFHSTPLDRFRLVEDHTCVTSLVDVGEETFLHINGAWQNGHPYDSFHILIGLLPALLHENPERGLAIGLGIGSTAYAMAQDPRLDRVDCVEICGGQRRLIEVLATAGSRSSQRLLADPRVNLVDGDGRRWLLANPEPYDVVAVDPGRPNTAYAGNLYSVEFYELVSSRLADDGIFIQWVPTERVLNSVRRVFPHVALATVPEYFDSRFLVASRRPLKLHRNRLSERLKQVDLTASFDDQQARSLVSWIESSDFERLWRPKQIDQAPDRIFNRDLHPRDEYFLNRN